MHRDGTPDEFDRDREEWEDAQRILAEQALLNLHAVEEWMNSRESDADVLGYRWRVRALLAHCRALRAALRAKADYERAATVLAQATDE